MGSRRFKLLVCAVLVVCGVFIFSLSKIHELSLENERLYIALNCAYRNIPESIRQDDLEKLRNLQVAMIYDLAKEGPVVANSRDRKNGCLVTFGM